MIISIFTIIGLGFLFAVFLFFKYRNANTTALPNIKPLDYSKPIITGSTIEYKLRQTIYELEQQILALQEEIESLIQYQMDILDKIGKASHIPLKTQKLFFQIIHPFKKEDRYYYERDLNKGILQEELTEKKQTLENYSVHISVTLSKWTLHMELLKVHQRNLEALEALEAQKQQMQKDKLAQTNTTFDRQHKNEVNTQYAIALLERIDEELKDRAEYLRQYILLEQAYDHSQNIQAHQLYKQKIDEIIRHMNNES